MVVLPKDVFLEIAEQGRHSLHGNLARVLVERGKDVPEWEDWVETHKRILQSIINNRNDPMAKRAAHEYLSYVVAGAAAYELLGGKAVVPEELKEAPGRV